MAFGGWIKEEGVRSDDPWNRQDESAARIQAQSRMQVRETEPAPEKRQAVPRQAQPRQRETPPARRAAPRPRINPIRAAVILLAIFSLVSGVLGSFLEEIAEPPRFPELPDESPTIRRDGERRDFFREYFQGSAGSSDIERVTPDAAAALELLTAPGDELTLQEIYEKCIPSVVAVVTRYADNDDYIGWGSGVIFTADGYIVTNSHVLEGAASASVRLWDDRELEALLVNRDIANDIAVLKVDGVNLQPAEFGDSDALRVGDAVAAIGNPMNPQLRGTMTSGIVSAIDRQVPVDGSVMTLIQTDAAINGGNSGGALIDRFGRVVGITNMKMMSYVSTVEGLCFAIPTRTVQAVVARFMASGYSAGTPGLGATVGPMNPEVRTRFGLPEGLYVSDVVPSSGADLAGIAEGDVIIAAEGIPLHDTEELAAVRDEKSIGDTLRLTVWRDGEVWDVEVELMDMQTLYS